MNKQIKQHTRINSNNNNDNYDIVAKNKQQLK